MAVPPNPSEPLVGSSPVGLEPHELSSGATTPFYPPANQQGLALPPTKPPSASTSPFAPATGTTGQPVGLGLNGENPATSPPFASSSTSQQGLPLQLSSNPASASPFAPATAGQATLYPSASRFASVSSSQPALSAMGTTGKSSTPITPFDNGQRSIGQASGAPMVLGGKRGFRSSLSLASGNASSSSSLVATNHVAPLLSVPPAGSSYGGGSSTANGQNSSLFEPNVEQPLPSASVLASNPIDALPGPPLQEAPSNRTGTLGTQASTQASGNTQVVHHQPTHHRVPSTQSIHGSSLTNAHGTGPSSTLHSAPTIPTNNLGLNTLQPNDQQPQSIPLLSNEPLLPLPQYNLFDSQVPPSNVTHTPSGFLHLPPESQSLDEEPLVQERTARAPFCSR